ncbi:MAG: hypothetical protein ACM3SU_18765 [Acidobacteriota bacterium]
MKSLFVISPAAGNARGTRGARAAERRKSQRRMEIPRRIVPDRRSPGGLAGQSERRSRTDRRVTGARRRVLDRRIGLSPDLDLYLLGI